MSGLEYVNTDDGKELHGYSAHIAFSGASVVLTAQSYALLEVLARRVVGDRFFILDKSKCKRVKMSSLGDVK